MSINVPCRDCGRQYHVSDDLAGRTFRCKSCGAGVSVPADDANRYRERESTPEPAFDDDIPNPYGPGGSKERRTPQPRPAAAKPASPSVLAAIGIAGFGLLVIVIALAARGPRFRPFAGGGRRAAPAIEMAEALPPATAGPWNAPDVSLRNFPPLGPAESIDGSTVKFYSVDFGSIPQSRGVPARKMKLRVYLPTGELPEKSIPLVLVAPAGTTLVHGIDLDPEDYHEETLPYAEAGMCVVHYSLDGPLSTDNPTGFQFLSAHKQFEAAQAGVLNARNALEFALARIPAVDPRRIYVAGHSSAGTLALLVAALEPRVAACLAYAPCTDVLNQRREIMDQPFVRFSVPAMETFLARSSPATHVKEIHCPTFLFYSKEDEVAPLTDNRPFIQELETNNPDATLVEVPSGNHTSSMLEDGIPKGIAWLTAKTPTLAEPAAAAPADIPPAAQ